MPTKDPDALREDAKQRHLAAQDPASRAGVRVLPTTSGTREEERDLEDAPVPEGAPPTFGEYLQRKMYQGGIPNDGVRTLLARIEQLHEQYHNGWED